MLTAGLGTRLRPLSFVRAKPAVPVAGEPLVRRLLRYGAGWGIRDFVLNLHYLPETITAQVGDGSDLGVKVRYSFESPVLGSAGGPRKALALLPDEAFFIINGDTLTNVDLHSMAANHRETGALVTIAVIPNERPDRYGGLIVDSTGRFHSVVPPGSRVRSYHVVGVQIAHPSAFARLPVNQPAESIGALYKELVRENLGHVRAFLCDADFWDVGTPADYLDACLSIGRAEGGGLQIGRGSNLDDSAHLTDSVIWDDVSVGAGATLERCIVADGVTIPSGARFRNSAIIQRDGELIVADII
jgi:NDP-sugar pyrophosphorylase family protein